MRVLSSELSGAVSTTAHALAVSVSPGDTRLEAREEKTVQLSRGIFVNESQMKKRLFQNNSNNL